MRYGNYQRLSSIFFYNDVKSFHYRGGGLSRLTGLPRSSKVIFIPCLYDNIFLPASRDKGLFASRDQIILGESLKMHMDWDEFLSFNLV